jgi:hypothetical protein
VLNLTSLTTNDTINLLADKELTHSDIIDSYLGKPLYYKEGDYLLVGKVQLQGDRLCGFDIDNYPIELAGVAFYPYCDSVVHLHDHLLNLEALSYRANRVDWGTLTEEQLTAILAILGASNT